MIDPVVVFTAFSIIGTFGMAGHWIDGYVNHVDEEIKKVPWNVKMANRRGRSDHPQTIEGAYERYLADDTVEPDWTGFERAVEAIVNDNVPAWNGHLKDCAYAHFPMDPLDMISVVTDEDVFIGDNLKKKGEAAAMCRRCGGIIG